jgi:hypothetical protein
MKRSITSVGLTLGTAALLALAAGCSHEKPAQTPASSTTSPTFESNVPSTSTQPGAMGQQPGSQPGQLGTQPYQPGGQQFQPGAEPGQVGVQQPQPSGQPYQPGAQPSPYPGQPSASETPPLNERALCDKLATGAKLRVEDVQNGVAIVLVPKAGTNLSTVRDNARDFEQAFQPQGGVVPEASAGEACGLFSLARLSGVMTSITEGANSVRIILTTSNAGDLKDLRRNTRDEINALNKSTLQQGGKKP